MFAEASASLSALAAYSIAAARKATTSETQKAMAPRTKLEHLILKVYAGFELERNLEKMRGWKSPHILWVP
jgi:hypothetical protein